MAYIYIGPTVKRLNLATNRVYKAYPQEFLTDLKAQGLSLIGQLVVDVEYLNKARIEMNTKGTSRSEAVNQIRKIMGGNQ